MQYNPQLVPHTKVNLKRSMNLNIKPESAKLLEENEKFFFHFVLGKYFINMITRVQFIKNYEHSTSLQ